MNLTTQSLYPKTYAVTLADVHSLSYYPKPNLVTLEDFPPLVQEALDRFHPTTQQLELLFVSGGDDERWDVIASALKALAKHRSQRYSLQASLAEQGITKHNPLITLAESTIALLADECPHPSLHFCGIVG